MREPPHQPEPGVRLSRPLGQAEAYPAMDQRTAITVLAQP
jgi:hypothetical protein